MVDKLLKLRKRSWISNRLKIIQELITFIPNRYRGTLWPQKNTSHKLFNVVQIETHNTCSRKCWFCKFGQERQDPEIMFMSNETVSTIANGLHELDYSGRISLYGINEPLLEPRLLDLITLFKLKCPRSFITINTNGDKLTEAWYQQLLTAGLDCLIIDIYDDLAMTRLRKYGAYQKVALKDRRKPNGEIDNRGGSIKINQNQFHPEKFIESNCLRPSKMLQILPNGDVSLCANDMYGDVIMGNVMHQTLEEIWNSERFQLYRNQLKANGRANLKLCQNCSHNGKTSRRNSYNLIYWETRRTIIQVCTKLTMK